jgi:hypothetical protein
MIVPSTRPATLAARPATDSELRLRFLYTAAAAAFLLAAAALAVVRSVQPCDHGWWLVSYLALVGGVSQLLLGGGRLMLAATRASGRRRRRTPWAELVLWNVGTLLVPVGVLADTAEVVAAGSVVLLVALALFAAASRTPAAAGPALDQRSHLWAYRGLVGFLAGSVVVGAGLADALPWQWG